jgi:hypothetical protein
MFQVLIEELRLETVSAKEKQVRGLSRRTGMSPYTSPHGGISKHRTSGDPSLDKAVRDNKATRTVAATKEQYKKSLGSYNAREPAARTVRNMRDAAKKHGTDSSSQNPKTIRKRERKAAAAKRKPMPLPKDR